MKPGKYTHTGKARQVIRNTSLKPNRALAGCPRCRSYRIGPMLGMGAAKLIALAVLAAFAVPAAASTLDTCEGAKARWGLLYS